MKTLQLSVRVKNKLSMQSTPNSLCTGCLYCKQTMESFVTSLLLISHCRIRADLQNWVPSYSLSCEELGHSHILMFLPAVFATTHRNGTF